MGRLLCSFTILQIFTNVSACSIPLLKASHMLVDAWIFIAVLWSFSVVVGVWVLILGGVSVVVEYPGGSTVGLNLDRSSWALLCRAGVLLLCISWFEG